jgi:hypothetical protein
MAADHDVSIGTATLVKTWIDASSAKPEGAPNRHDPA